MSKAIENPGFTPPPGRQLGNERRFAALAELATVGGLALSIIVAVTVVSAGIARAAVGDGVIGNEGSLFTVALLLGIVFIGLGAIASMKPTNRHRH
jgi:hypothetical protein